MRGLDVKMAQARIVLSLLTMLSLYIDPTTAGGLFNLTPSVLVILLLHLLYSTSFYHAIRREVISPLSPISNALDLIFAGLIAFFAEGQTSPAFVFFLYAIIAAGIRPGWRDTIVVTFLSVVTYSTAIELAHEMNGQFMMRAAYLAISGYLIGFVGQQRAFFENEMRKLEIRSQRQTIARSLHDGYVQALAGVNLRLGTSRELIARGQVEEAANALEELQSGVAREYDEVRTYLRSLAGIDQKVRRSAPLASGANPIFQIDAMYNGTAQVGEHLLQIMLEGLRNAQRHANADKVIVSLIETNEMTLLKIDDNGVGFTDADKAPWSIVSRVKELGGNMTLSEIEGSTSLTIELPHN